jgi:hypothetical protein
MCKVNFLILLALRLRVLSCSVWSKTVGFELPPSVRYAARTEGKIVMFCYATKKR